MSSVWKINLFKKISSEVTACKKCDPTVFFKMTDGSTKLLRKHIEIHAEEAAIFKKLEEGVPTVPMNIFVTKEKKKDSANLLDRKIINFISVNCLPFSIVDEMTFKVLLSENDRNALKGRQYYSDKVLPMYYRDIKDKMKMELKTIPYLSFTSDVWTGPTKSFISLTAHGINKFWKRFKLTLCVQPFPGSHTADAISKMVNQMFKSWDVQRNQVHVLIRDEGANMKKVVC